MIRVLFIARYRDQTMRRKVDYLARQPDLTVRYIHPLHWVDELIEVHQPGVAGGTFEHSALAMLGRPNDPHRALYRSVTFGMGRFRPDIIHVEEEPDSLAALQLVLARRLFCPGAKLLLHTWQNIDRPKRRHVRMVIRQTLRAADAVFCANQEAIALLESFGYAGPLPLIPALGVDTETFVPCGRRTERANTFTIGYIGRFVPEKGIDTLLAALARLRQQRRPGDPDWSLRLIGAGPLHAQLERQSRELGITCRVTFVPAMSPARIARELRDIDAVVLPSRTTSVWKEQLGRVLLEAMASRVPVVGSDSGAIPEVIGDAGLTFPEGNVESMVGCLRHLVESPHLRDGMTERALQRVHELYSQRSLAEQTAEFYRKILNSFNPSLER